MQSSECIACLIMLMWTVQLLRAGTSFTDGSTAGHLRSKGQRLIPKCCVAWDSYFDSSLIAGLVTELGDSKCPGFPPKLLGMKAARRGWLCPRPLAWAPCWCHLLAHRAGTWPHVPCSSAGEYRCFLGRCWQKGIGSASLGTGHFSWTVGKVTHYKYR